MDILGYLYMMQPVFLKCKCKEMPEVVLLGIFHTQNVLEDTTPAIEDYLSAEVTN